MWVWTDELMESQETDRQVTGRELPLVAYAIEGERDLETLAREIFRLAAATPGAAEAVRRRGAYS